MHIGFAKTFKNVKHKQLLKILHKTDILVNYKDIRIVADLIRNTFTENIETNRDVHEGYILNHFVQYLF